MQKIVYTNSRGESITISQTQPYILSFLDGTGGSGTDVQMQKSPGQDGSGFLDVLLDSRPLNVEVTIIGEDIFSYREKMSRVFNPKLGEGLLQYYYGSNLKEIKCAVDLAPVFPSGKENRGVNFQKAMFALVAPNPYWTSPSITEEPTFQPLFQFPFEGEFEMGIQRDQRIIMNNGDAAAPLQIEFNGPAVNPIIMNNTTGEFIKVNRTLGEDEFMRIDTDDANVKVEFVAADGTVTNVLNWIDLESEFFKLVVGENDIEYSADSDIQGAIVNISYRKLYVGI
ncbi:phage tail protein [Alkalihalophilus pseudofirmus]|uniref:phage distal tail protein n=1 Tax=Alkalihalophilus pseudofirmus TaxID=79885 RepID=UPI000952EDD4|nr:phage tail protein [Alkalihalophilus pseudofirmus]